MCPGLKVQYDYYSCYIHISGHNSSVTTDPKFCISLPPLVSAQPSHLSPLQKKRTHTPFTNHFLFKAANCMDRLYLEESSGVYISKGDCVVAEAITNKLSPPEDLPTSSTSVSTFFLRGSCWGNATLYSLIYLIMVMTKVLSTCLGGKQEKNTCQVFILCNQGGIAWKDQRRLDVGGNNGVFKERAGDGWVE